ncbi:type II toxin-antitoxin system RelE/ParE family toxin [Acidithiobacillus ferrooxidans]|uniref:type II toxin-antitoxin system RelE/ParE family toxin n=1 Tax=Acidithiobacillus ferrooxidans TaxID=920 RepID=UPI001C076647|nr:type II toxin-antitoxin system RelE/ParE family toxin [Acidithiobacillus ferrooxidans]MBU2856808.1 type II toxin-antitoxin system RelE/ParE family toxin [Acidithiobacillus ferrooxidans]
MIKSFRCKDTQSLFEGGAPRRFQGVRPQAERKLLMVDSAKDLKDLKSPPGNGLEKLSGDRKDQWSIRINDQWRICFDWREGDAYDVEIVDYH